MRESKDKRYKGQNKFISLSTSGRPQPGMFYRMLPKRKKEVREVEEGIMFGGEEEKVGGI